MTERRHRLTHYGIVFAAGLAFGALAYAIAGARGSGVVPSARAAPAGFVMIDLLNDVCYPALDLRRMGMDLVPVSKRGHISLDVADGKTEWSEQPWLECYARNPNDHTLGELVATLRTETYRPRRIR